MTTAQCVGELVTYNSHEEYNADDRVRSTQLKDMMSPQGPRAYYLKYVNPVPNVDKEYDKNAHIQPKVDDMVLGSLLHEYALEGKKNWFACKSRRGSAAWMDEIDEHDGKWAVTETNARNLDAWRDAMMRNAEVREIVESGSFSEQSFQFTHWTGIKAKARADLFAFDGTIWDLKTTRHSDRRGFERQFRDLNYGFSAAFYEIARNSVPELHGMRAPFKHIVLCKKWPYYCYVWPCSREYLTVGHRDVHAAFERLQDCLTREASGMDPLNAWPDLQERTQGDASVPDDWWLSQNNFVPDDYEPEVF